MVHLLWIDPLQCKGRYNFQRRAKQVNHTDDDEVGTSIHKPTPLKRNTDGPSLTTRAEITKEDPKAITIVPAPVASSLLGSESIERSEEMAQEIFGFEEPHQMNSRLKKIKKLTMFLLTTAPVDSSLA